MPLDKKHKPHCVCWPLTNCALAALLQKYELGVIPSQNNESRRPVVCLALYFGHGKVGYEI